jgi:hypothetical protein
MKGICKMKRSQKIPRKALQFKHHGQKDGRKPKEDGSTNTKSQNKFRCLNVTDAEEITLLVP